MWCIGRYPDNCPQKKIAPRLGLGLGSRSGLVLGLDGNETIAAEKNCPPVRVRVWLRVSFGVGGQFSSGTMILEPFRNKTNISINNSVLRILSNIFDGSFLRKWLSIYLKLLNIYDRRLTRS